MNLPDPDLVYYQDIVPSVVGRALIAWNNVSYAIYTLFQALTGFDEETAKAAFFCVASDRSQRDMVVALVEHKLKPGHPKTAKKALSLIGDVNRLAGKRNDIAHIVFLNEDDPQQVKPFNNRGHIKNQLGPELLDAIHGTTIECLKLSMAILNISIQIHQNSGYDRLLPKILEQISQQEAEELANHGGFGLLSGLATILPSDEDPHREKD